MTYRSTSGLGADISPAASAALTKAVNAAGGCSAALQNSANGISCMPLPYVQYMAGCYAGVTPPGVSDVEFASACLSLGKCGFTTKPGCPADEAAMLPQIPKCIPTTMGPLISYCRAHPSFDGPDKTLNASCWGISRYQDVYSQLMALPGCNPPVTQDPRVTRPQAPSESTPTNLQMTPDAVTAPAAAQSDMTKYALYGAAWLAALGLGYLLLRRKH